MKKFVTIISLCLLVGVIYAKDGDSKPTNMPNLMGATGTIPHIQENNMNIIWSSGNMSAGCVLSGFVEVVVRDKNTDGIVQFEVFELTDETVNLENYPTDEYVIEVYVISERKDQCVIRIE